MLTKSCARLLASALIVISFIAAAGPALAADSSFASKAPRAILIDAATGATLFQQSADEPAPPASMSKLMTLAVVFGELKSGKIQLTDQFFISDHAFKDGGAASGSSTMFAVLHSKIPVEDLLYGLIVQSGNDAAIALAEGIAGSEGA